MRWKLVRRSLVAWLLAVAAMGCRGQEEGEEQVPAVLRHQFQTQMKTILHDVQVAQEQASAFEGRYLEMAELRRKYFNRPVPENYELSLQEVSPDGYSAEVVHRRSGLRCWLAVGEGTGGGGVPRCE